MRSIRVKDANDIVHVTRYLSSYDCAGKDLLVTFEPYKENRTNPQNALYWAGVLNDFSCQGIINGKQFATNIWHEFLRTKFLPEAYEEGKTRKRYRKWTELPDGSLVMFGSTTSLTKEGFSDYLEKCYAFGSEELEIKFTTNREY
jgi:hypothetical protein